MVDARVSTCFYGAVGEVEVGSRIIRALESAMHAVHQNHPDVPYAVINIETRSTALAFFARSAWKVDGEEAAAIAITRLCLGHDASFVFGALLHECAHGLAYTRQWQDCSRQGRYHNGFFRRAADELGLDATWSRARGYAHTTIRASTLDLYAVQVRGIGLALAAFPLSAAPHDGAPDATKSRIVVVCACRSTRLASQFLEDGPVICGNCMQPFIPRSARFD